MGLKPDQYTTEVALRPHLDTLLPEIERRRTHYLVEQEPDILAIARANTGHGIPSEDPLAQVAQVKTALSRQALQLNRIEGLLKELVARDQTRPIEYDDAPVMQ